MAGKPSVAGSGTEYEKLSRKMNPLVGAMPTAWPLEMDGLSAM